MATKYSELLFFFFFTLSIVRYYKEYQRTQRFGNWMCFLPQVKCSETPTLFGPSERAKINPECYTPSSEPFKILMVTRCNISKAATEDLQSEFSIRGTENCTVNCEKLTQVLYNCQEISKYIN
jgi:hypothetical protein